VPSVAFIGHNLVPRHDHVLPFRENFVVCYAAQLIELLIAIIKVSRHENWLRTGDLGYRDEDGFFFIVGRKKELIIRGGYNVYPREVEEVLYAHPAVAEAAVTAIPDERLGEEVKAYCSLKPGQSVSERELIAFVKLWTPSS